MNFPTGKILLTETIDFSGHQNILGTHYNTIEVTKDYEISKRADCIIGVGATKACSDLSSELKKHIQSSGDLYFVLTVSSDRFSFRGRGSKKLSLSDPRELVVRRSDFASDRTAAISCDAAAIDIPRELIRALQSPSARATLNIHALDNFGTDDFPIGLLEQ